jgi:hypothetical protein
MTVQIGDLLPEEWPDNVAVATKSWQQGDLVEGPPLFYGACPQSPLLPYTADNGRDDRAWQVFSLSTDARPPYGAVISQTCDICEPSPSNPFINVAPVYNVATRFNDAQQQELKRHRYNDFVYLTNQPIADGFYVVDLRIFLPLEKGALVGRDPIKGFKTEIDQLDFADRVATRLRRPSYADAVHDFLIAPLDNWIKRESSAALKSGSGSFTDVEEVRLGIDGPRLAPKSVQLIVFEETQLSMADRSTWRNWRNQNRKEFLRNTGIDLLPVRFGSLSKMPARDYRVLAPVWLRNLGRAPRY